jgi:2'-5' RNA ligase
MHGIVSILDAPNFARVEAVWHDLENECGLTGVFITPVPHFSWQIASDYNFQSLVSLIEGISHATQPFVIHASGLALFTGEKPVVYIPIVRDACLTDLHERVWQASAGCGIDLSPFYAPQAWMPHITIAYGDVSHQTLACLMDRLAFQDLNFKIQVDNLTFVFQPEDQVGVVVKKFALGS